MSSNPTIITNVLSPNNPHITNFDPRERYVLQGILGEGGYGRVYQALDTVRQQLVAIKIIDLESAGDEVQDAHREIAVMANLHCPHLIQYYASYVINTNLWIVMEYLDAGSLLDIIKELGPLPESFIAYIIKEILLALQYLHHERKIHRDVKAGNLLVGSDGSVKLADFGVAGQLTDSVDKRQSKIGTPFWMAPEVITESKYDGGADIWSLGITAIELATGLPPYAQKVHPFRVILLIPKNPPPVLEGDFSETFKNFVASCLVKDPLQRPTATQLLEHPFVKDAVRSEGWKTFIAEKVMVNRYVPERDPSSELVRTGSNDSNCSNWNLTQKTAGSSSSRHRNAQIASSNSGNLNPSSSSFINVRTPRQGSISRGLAIENTNGFDDIIINSPRTPARNNSERNLEELMTINSHTPRGLMSPGHRQRQISSPRVPLPDDNLSLGGGSTRSRRGSGNSETLLILANNAGVSSVSSATASSGTGASNNNTSIAGSGKIHSNLMDSELTPPARVNPLRLPSTGFGINNSDQSFLPPLSNPSATNTNLIPEMIHVEPTSSLYRDMHSSISNSSSRDYDAGSSLHDSRSQFSSFIQNPNQSLLSIRGVNSSSSQQLLAGAKQGLSDASKAKSMPNMNSSLTSSGSIAFPSLNNGPQPGVLGQDELITYFQSWKQKEDYYLNEIHRLKEENLRLRSISKPFLSTVSVLVRNTNKVGGVAGEGSNANGGNVSSSSFDHYLGTGNNSHNNSSNQLAAIFHSMNTNANTNTNATTNGVPGGGTGSADGGHLKSNSSFKDIQSILSISSDDTTPGPSRSLSPAAVVRDDIFADLASTHPNHPLLQRQLASAASSTNSLLMPQQAPPPPDELQTKALTDHPSEEKKGEDDEGGGKEGNEDILLRQSSFQLPPLPPAHHQSSNSGVPLTISVSQSYDDGNHHHYQNPNFLKSEETVPYPVPVIERGTAPVNGGARVMGYGIGDPSRSLDSVHPSSMIADPRSHSLDSADFETKHPTIKQLLKTPKFATTPTSSNNPSSSELQAQHRKFLETIVEHHLQQPSFVSTTSITAESGTAPSTGGEGGGGTVASSSNSGKTNQSGSVGSRLMEAVIKPTLQEVKQRIERNIYTPEVVVSNKTAEKKEGQDDINAGGSEKAINKEAEIKKQQLENIWLLLATGFTALEKILSTPSAPSNDPSTTSTHNSGDPMQLSGTKDSTFKPVSVNGSEGSGSSSNMLVDFASLVTSFTLSELDEQP